MRRLFYRRPSYLEILCRLSEPCVAMSTFILIPLGVVGLIACSAAVCALAELMAQGEDYAEPLKDDPTWFGSPRDRAEGYVSAPTDRQPDALIEIDDRPEAHGGETAADVQARRENRKLHVAPPR